MELAWRSKTDNGQGSRAGNPGTALLEGNGPGNAGVHRALRSSSLIFSDHCCYALDLPEAEIPSLAQVRVGTSGYAYKEWKGPFYPEKLPDREMLPFYSQHFPTVEINHTFYRMPNERLLEEWAQSVPQGFQFALKANQKITHIMRLRSCESTLKHFLAVASILAEGNHLGPILVQLPPNFRADLNLLEEFLKLRPHAFRFALEVRHPSWYTDQMYALLRQYETALCLAETDEGAPPHLVTASFAYVRLRRDAYTPKQLSAWKETFEGWRRQGLDVYAYAKHESAGKAAEYALRLRSVTET